MDMTMMEKNALIKMNSATYPVPVKLEDEYCDQETDRDDMHNPHAPLPYMGTFGKHPTGPAMAMFYPQLSYDLHPLLLNQRRRSSLSDKMQEMTEPMDDPSALHDASLIGLQLRESAGRFKATKTKMPAKRRENAIHDNQFSLPDNPAGVMDEVSPEFASKHRKSFFCRSCGKTFKFQTSLLRHNNKVHISKYQCHACSRVFSRQAYLDVHTSKQGSSCYLDPALRIPRGRPQLQALSATSD